MPGVALLDTAPRSSGRSTSPWRRIRYCRRSATGRLLRGQSSRLVVGVAVIAARRKKSPALASALDVDAGQLFQDVEPT